MLPNYALIQSIKHGQLDQMSAAISNGASLDYRDFDGKTPLEVAMERGQLAMARTLVQLGADVDQPIGKQGEVLLHRAARTGNFGFASLLIELGADPDPVNNAGKTPLLQAVGKGYQYFVEDLIKAGASVSRQTPQGDQPLHIAARRGDVPVIKSLLRAGADPLAKNNTGYSALHESAAAGKTQAVELLIEKTHLGRHTRQALLPRVRYAAELHGHEDTAAAILAAEGHDLAVAESQARQSAKHQLR